MNHLNSYLIAFSFVAVGDAAVAGVFIYKDDKETAREPGTSPDRIRLRERGAQQHCSQRV